MGSQLPHSVGVYPGILPDLAEAIFAGSENSMDDPKVELHVYELQNFASCANCTIVLTHYLNCGAMTKSIICRDVASHGLSGSSYTFNSVSDASGTLKTEEETSAHQCCRMKKCQIRSLLCQDGQVYDLEG